MSEIWDTFGRILESATTLGLSRAITYLLLVPVALLVVWFFVKLIKWHFRRLKNRALQKVTQLPAAAVRQAAGKVMDVGVAAGQIAANAGRGAADLAAQHAMPAAQFVGRKAVDGAVGVKDAAIVAAPAVAKLVVHAAGNAAPVVGNAVGKVAGFVAGQAGQIAENVKQGYVAGREAAAEQKPNSKNTPH